MNSRMTKYGIITKPGIAVERLNSDTGGEFTEDYLVKMVNDSTEVTYTTFKGEVTSKRFANNCFIRLDNATHRYTHEYIYLSMYKNKDTADWQGFFVGTDKKLRDQLFNDEFEERQREFNLEIYNIYNQLLDKEHWLVDDSLVRLCSYLNTVYARCSYISQHTNHDVITINEAGDRICFNTRLLDNFGNFIYLICDKDSAVSRLRNIQSIVSKSDFIKNGFKGERPSPVSFFNDIRDVVFQGNIDEFDFEDTDHLNHLIEDSHKQRLPEAYQNISAVDMANSVKYSIEMALKMLITDYRYIVPMYNIRNNKIQFLAPLCLKKEYSEIPEVALIINKNEETGLYTVNTLIDVGIAYSNSRVISASTASWLERAITSRQLSEAETEETLQNNTI